MFRQCLKKINWKHQYIINSPEEKIDEFYWLKDGTDTSIKKDNQSHDVPVVNDDGCKMLNL